MWRTVLVIASLLCLPACAPKWQRADTSPQQLAQDDYECIQETREPAPQVVMAPAPYGYPAGAAYQTQTWDGFTIARNMRSRNAYQACMRARGYTTE